MKRELLFFLTALLLFVTGNAWGGTSEVFSQASWSHTHDGGTGDRSASLSFTGTSSIDDNWTASFDVTTTSTNSRTNGTRNFQVALLSASAASFPSNALATTNVLLGANFVTTTNTDYSSFPCTITVNDVAEAGTVTLNHGTKYTFTVSVNGTSMTVSIKNGETSVFSKAVTLGSFVKPKGIYDLLPRPYNAGWGVYTNTYSDILVTKEVSQEAVTNPSISVAYAGENRTVTITPGVSSESNVVTTYYTLNGEDPTSSSSVYSTPLDIDADCTVKAISISSTSVASEIVSQAVTVGKLKLVAPTFTKTGYAAGKYTVSMASNQSSLAFPPASYTNYYSIDGGAAVAYSAPFELSEGSTVTGYVVATNYTNSDETTLTSAVRPILSEVWSIDFAGQATYDKGGVTIGEAAFTASGVSFGNITSEGLTSNDNFGIKTGTTWLLRNNSRGLYSQNGSGTPVGVQGLKAGQYIKMVVDLTGLYVSDAASLVDEMSTVTEKYIVVNSDGNANINFDRYGYIKSIAVCDEITPVQIAIADCKTYDTSAAFATAIDAESFSTAAEVYAFNTSYHITNGVLTDGVRDITGVIRNAQVNDADATDWDGAGTYNGEQYEGAPDPYFIDNYGAQMWATQWVYGLPAGRYQVKVATRGAAANYNHIYISNGTEDIGRVQGTHVGNTGGELGNGWSWTYVPFTITETTNLIFGFYKNATNWAGCDDWHLYRIESVSKTITAAKWATYCSPYILDFSSSIDNLDEAYIVTGGEAGVLTLVEVDGTVPANTGLLLKGEGECVIPVAASSSTDVSANKLVGVTSSTELPAENGYVLMGSPKIGFYKNANAFTVGANTAYLPIDFDVTTSDARVAFFGFDENVTAINAIEAAEAETGALKDGKYLIEGKIVLVKNGVKYSANGQILK